MSYTWETHYGGVILTAPDGETRFLQAGDDTEQFLDHVDVFDTLLDDEAYETALNDLIGAYF